MLMFLLFSCYEFCYQLLCFKSLMPVSRSFGAVVGLLMLSLLIITSTTTVPATAITNVRSIVIAMVRRITIISIVFVVSIGISIVADVGRVRSWNLVVQRCPSCEILPLVLN